MSKHTDSFRTSESHEIFLFRRRLKDVCSIDGVLVSSGSILRTSGINELAVGERVPLWRWILADPADIGETMKS